MSGEGARTFIRTVPSGARDPAVVGRWKHFKGGEYEFVGLVQISPDGPLVLYLDAEGSVWLRPRSMINQLVEHGGERVARFVRIDR